MQADAHHAAGAGVTSASTVGSGYDGRVTGLQLGQCAVIVARTGPIGTDTNW